jgi:hypothetical protein
VHGQNPQKTKIRILDISANIASNQIIFASFKPPKSIL